MKILKLPEYAALKEGATVLEADGFGEKVLRLADGTILKLFRRKRLFSSAAWVPYARRFTENAAALRKLGFAVPEVLAVMRIPELSRDAIHYMPLEGMTLREAARAGLEAPRQARLKEAFNQLVIDLHEKGVYFRSLHTGNVICMPDDRLGLIDISDVRFYRTSLSPYWRARNLKRIQGIPEERGWIDYETVMGADPSKLRASPRSGDSGTHWLIARDMLSGLLRGCLWVWNGHLPPAGHAIPPSFAGVGVAAARDPSVDDYLIARLHDLGIRHIRLDFSYGDEGRPAGRLLERILSEGFAVLLHLVQPLAAAQAMGTEAARITWQNFVVQTLNRYGGRIETLEIGSTLNRKRWAGYTVEGFLAAWGIAHREARVRGIVLAGPSITDFEPLYNLAWLSLLGRKKLLPDIHTDNLFSERCTEPERYDHKVFGRLLAPVFRINLIRKARMLEKIGADRGVPRLWSPAAFWTLPRIARLLPQSEEKQADYLARYLVLCAASGALERAWWGPLICQREGLIDNGATGYPALERITHYAGIEGTLENFRIRPAFGALRAFQSLIPGSRYAGRLVAGQGLEVHSFATPQATVHSLWTINGKVAALEDIYAPADIATAQFIARNGDVFGAAPTLVGEAPIYASWPPGYRVTVNAQATCLKDVAIDWHVPGQTHVLFRENGWQGIVRARDAEEAKRLLATIHPERIGMPPAESVLRHARNAIWTIDDPRMPGAQLVVKQPVKMHIHKKLFDRFKPSKGLRSWNGTHELLRRGISAAPPVAWFEKAGDVTLLQNYYLCEYVPAEFTAREMMSAYAGGASRYQGIDARNAYRQLVDYLLAMHERGIFFRDLSGGNILIRRNDDGRLNFSLIDTGRIHVFPRPLPLGKRLADLVRICNKLHWAGRKDFIGNYLASLGRKLAWWHTLPFAAYDTKVWLKRNVGRKALKRLMGAR